MAKVTRKHNIHFMVTEEERDMIKRRMEQSGMKNMRAYMLKMAVDGRVISVEFESIREMVRLLLNATNNINQISQTRQPNRQYLCRRCGGTAWAV